MNESEVSGAGGSLAGELDMHSPARRLIAPWWHTLLLTVLVVGNSVLGAKGMQKLGTQVHSRVPTYLASIVLEWVIAGLVLWGIHLRRVPLRQLLGERRRGLRSWAKDAAAAFLTWLMVLMVVGTIRLALLRLLHNDPQYAAKVVLKLAPVTKLELLVFLLLSLSAGISEELFFRGYLQQQFARIGRRVWVGVAVSALLFGAAHGYEGIDTMIAIVAFGAVLSVLVLVRGSLRAAMMLHVGHDAMTGIVLALAQRYVTHGLPH